MKQKKDSHEIIMLVLIYVVGLTSSMSLALEPQSPVNLLAISSIEDTAGKMHRDK